MNAVVKETLINLSQQKSEMKSIEIAVKDQKNMMAQYVAQMQAVMKTVFDKFTRGIIFNIKRNFCDVLERFGY